jgi:hypothetical protein
LICNTKTCSSTTPILEKNATENQTMTKNNQGIVDIYPSAELAGGLLGSKHKSARIITHNKTGGT